MLKNFQVRFFPSPLLKGAFSWNEIFVFSGGHICIQKKNLLVIWLIKWKRKNWLHADEFWDKWHVSSIIIRSKLNLLTEPENKNKQAAWIILLLSVNPTFLVREIFLKSSRILYLKNNTRLHEGFKLPLCTFHVVMQIQANFTAIAKSIFYDFYWLFLCLTSLALLLLLWLRLSFTISFRNERKPVYKIAWQSKRFSPHISRVNFHFILGVNTDCRRML